MIQLTEGLKYDDVLPELRHLLAVIQLKHASIPEDILLVKYVPHHTRTDIGRLVFFDSRFVSDDDKPVFEVRYPSGSKSKSSYITGSTFGSLTK